MKGFYEKIISFDNAKRLREYKYTKDHGFKYDTEGNLFDPAVEGDSYRSVEAPTIGETIDWLMNFDIIISMDYIINAGWEYTVHRRTSMASYDCLLNGYESFDKCANEAIKIALIHYKDNLNN